MDDATEDPEHSAPGANSTLDPAASTRQTAGSERLVQQVLARRQAAFHGPDREPWRRDVQGGGARAAVFGVSDGLVSNVSLILGFAGAMPQPGVVRLAGIAGLLAGACSMAAGEYVSMRAQTELFERELSIEAAQITQDPTREERQLVEIFTARGVEPPTAVELGASCRRRPSWPWRRTRAKSSVSIRGRWAQRGALLGCRSPASWWERWCRCCRGSSSLAPVPWCGPCCSPLSRRC